MAVVVVQRQLAGHSLHHGEQQGHIYGGRWSDRVGDQELSDQTGAVSRGAHRSGDLPRLAREERGEEEEQQRE